MHTDLADQNRPIEEAHRERPTRPIRMRLQPQIFRLMGGADKKGQYRFWRDVHWTLELESPQEVYGVRDALRVFFRVLPKIGADAAIAALKGVKLIPIVPGAGGSGHEGAA